ncbi:G2 and S phase-expressed protein 1 isoform X2 [Cololabis saira]|uniref:G2 and S phase-expressed protein 1 isoform X2 n=1 Tax=Cololabis saira TaxID=129043 RepID=UPI002AD58B6D|nr:G2 and S phase-expressed protein 1 isoform X2 [Cololabis saira]
MEDCAAEHLFLLQDEKFDFDVSLSPASSKGDEDEDEVFVGPVSLKERCVSVGMVTRLDGGGAGVQGGWSPLSGDQLEAVCQEAHRLAGQLQGIGAVATAPADEEFLQDARAQLGVLRPAALSPIKRQTFCVRDSPMKTLPPAIRRQLLGGGSGPGTALPARRASTARLNTSSPVAGVKGQPRPVLRGKAPPGIAVVLPSKPVAPATRGRAEKSRLPPPPLSKAAVLKRSPAPRPAARAPSCEDLLSDSASVASDVSCDSLNSSLLGKRPLAPPTKGVKARNPSGVKASGPQGRRAADRKKTSSSSSSMSSFNSSLSASPTKGKLNSSLNPGPAGPAPSGVGWPRRSTAFTAAEPGPCAAGRRSLSVQSKKACDAERARAPRCTPLKRPEATPLQPTPPRRLPARLSSVTSEAAARPQGDLRARPKPEALVLPTPGSAGRGARRGEDVLKALRPTRLMSTSSVDSLPQRPSAAPPTPLQTRARRPSALPTPVKRRLSTAPGAAIATPPAGEAAAAHGDGPRRQSPPRLRRETGAVPDPPQREQNGVKRPEVPPLRLEGEESSVSPPPDTRQPGPPESPGRGPGLQTGPGPARNLIELDSTEESTGKTQEVLLLDLPTPTLRPQEKLLIDLRNTPDLIRTNSKTCSSTQLIDLSSPLIKWSPDDKKENNAPLINLSF